MNFNKWIIIFFFVCIERGVDGVKIKIDKSENKNWDIYFFVLYDEMICVYIINF